MTENQVILCCVVFSVLGLLSSVIRHERGDNIFDMLGDFLFWWWFFNASGWNDYE